MRKFRTAVRITRLEGPRISVRLAQDNLRNILRKHRDRVAVDPDDGLSARSTAKTREPELARTVLVTAEQRLNGAPKRRLSWIVPAPAPGSGGHRNIFRAVRGLAQRGHDVLVYVVPDRRFASSRDAQRAIEEWFFNLQAEVVLGVDAITPCDLLIATHWSTAYIAHRHRHRAGQIWYFVQDFEPMFAPMGMDYILAERSYQLGFRHIASGPWCSLMLREKFDLDVPFFRFPVDRQVYHPTAGAQETHESRRRVIFFAKPEAPRRCYPLGLDALRIVHTTMPDVEIVLFGSDQVSSSELGFAHNNVGLIRDLTELARLYQSATVGVAFSTTNPSLVPYEMMACGCPVVDLDYGRNDVNYGGRENVALAGPTGEEVAAAVIDLLRKPERRRDLARRGLEYVESFPDEEGMVDAVEQILLHLTR